jgi:hypothetical protein
VACQPRFSSDQLHAACHCRPRRARPVDGAVFLGIALSWSYSTGERAGWVQKLSKKGWVCKTWEGELALVSLPGSSVEKFYFTIRDDAVAEQVMQEMGKRVSCTTKRRSACRPPASARRVTS